MVGHSRNIIDSRSLNSLFFANKSVFIRKLVRIFKYIFIYTLDYSGNLCFLMLCNRIIVTLSKRNL